MWTEPSLSQPLSQYINKQSCRGPPASPTQFWPRPCKLHFWMCYSQLAFCKTTLRFQSRPVSQLDCQAFLPRPRRKNQRKLPLLMRAAFVNKGACVCCDSVALDPEHGHCLVRQAGEPAAWLRACVGIQITAESFGAVPIMWLVLALAARHSAVNSLQACLLRGQHPVW